MFLHFSLFPICDTETKRPRLRRNMILLRFGSIHKKKIPIAILCISSLIVIMCKLHKFAITKIHAVLSKSDSH